MAKGFIELELIRHDGDGTIVFNIRPEIISMYRSEGEQMLVWFDPHDAPFISNMTLDEFEAALMINSLDY